MNPTVQITVKDTTIPDAVRDECRHRATELGSHSARLTSCRVVVSTPHRRHRTGNGHEVTVTLSVPGGEIVGSHTDEAVDIAVREAFDAAHRRLDEHVERIGTRGTPPSLHGRVVRVRPDEGYAFLETPDGVEYFAHANDVRGDFSALQPGVEVHFLPEDPPGDEPGKDPIARSVHVAHTHGELPHYGE